MSAPTRIGGTTTVNVSLLAISVGNSRTHTGAFVDGKLEATSDLDNAKPDTFAAALDQALAALPAGQPKVVVLSSVNPPISDKIADLLAARGPDVVVRRVEKDLPIPVGRHLDPETLVGEDRLLNAAAAYDVLKQACVIVDAGTAITIDYVDGAGTFHGGAIGPGAQMMLDALHQRTAQLPEVELAAPREAIGHNTAEAIRSAVFHGLRGMVRELTEHYAEAAGSYPMVIATGGNAELLFKDYDLVERIVPDLTLRGLAITLQAAVDDGD
jgi:type III pantothenate kinase